MKPAPGDQLVVLRVDGWRFAVPVDRVRRVLSAAMPVCLPAGAASSYFLHLGPQLVPLVFAANLFGNEDILLGLEDKVVLLQLPQGELGLWVQAVEDIVDFAPLSGAAEVPASPHVACLAAHAASALPVLDLDGLA